MKKVLLTVAAVLASLNIYAQGTVAWGNTSTTLIRDDTKAGTPGISPAAAFKVGLYYDNVAGAAESSLSLYAMEVVNASLAGRFFGGTATLTDIVAGTAGTFQVRAWAAAFATYADAVAQGGVYGASRVVTHTTGGAGDPAGPASVLFGANTTSQLQGFSVVPEPSTIALGLLGVGALALLRRRK